MIIFKHIIDQFISCFQKIVIMEYVNFNNFLNQNFFNFNIFTHFFNLEISLVFRIFIYF